MLIKRSAYICLFFILFLTVAFSCDKNRFVAEIPSNHTSSLQDSINFVRQSIEKLRNDTTLLKAELEKNIAQNNKIHQLVLHNKLGEIHLNNYHFRSAVENHRRYLTLSEELNDPLQILTALNKLAYDYKKAYWLNDAINYYFRALKLSDNLEDTHADFLKQKADTYYEIGNIYSMFGYHDEAMTYFEKSYRYGETLNDKKNLADNRLGMGIVFQEKRLYDSARINYNKAMDLNIEANSKSGIALSFLQLGNLRVKQEVYQQALIYLNSAYETLRNTSDRLNWMEVCFALGDANIKLMNYTEAEKYLSEGLELAKNINLSFYLETAYSKLSALYDEQNKPELVAQNLVLAHRYSTLRNVSGLQAELFNSYVNYENERNTQQISEMKSEYDSKSNRLKVIIIITILIIILLISMSLARFQLALRKKERDKALMEMVKLKSDFYMKITHEFKTPISIIVGLVEKLRKTINEGKSAHNLIDLDIIGRQSENLLFLVNEILTISKIQSGSDIHWVNGNVVDYLRYLHSCYVDFVETKKITYLFHSSTDEIVMDYSKEQIRVVVNNLLTNSIKHCKEGNKILLMVREDKNQKKCIIEVVDSGEGITAKDLPHIFDTFYQGETDQQEQMGMGIGLAFTKKVVESLDGKISARSIPHKETVFTVEIPIINNGRVTNNVPLEEISYIPTHFEEKGPELENGKEDAKKPLILIAEDNRDMIFYLTNVLRDEYNIIVAHDGKEAISFADEKVPDIIISDLMMPVMDGNKMCTHLKNSVMTSHIPIIILTAKTSVEDRIQSINAGADAYMTKPFIEEELKAKINQLLSSRKELRTKYSQVVLENQTTPTELANDANFEFLQKVTDIIYREIKNNEFFPHGLASEMFISPSQLNRKIKSISGLNATNYVLMVRLNRAKKMLTTSQKPIGEIAMDCGFGDFAYFSKTFKKEFGITPSKYQRMPHQ